MTVPESERERASKRLWAAHQLDVREARSGKAGQRENCALQKRHCDISLPTKGFSLPLAPVDCGLTTWKGCYIILLLVKLTCLCECKISVNDFGCCVRSQIKDKWLIWKKQQAHRCEDFIKYAFFLLFCTQGHQLLRCIIILQCSYK